MHYVHCAPSDWIRLPLDVGVEPGFKLSAHTQVYEHSGSLVSAVGHKYVVDNK